MIQTQPLAWWQMVMPIVLVLIYAMLSYYAFFDQTFFFASMDMPAPNHDFLIWSWGGKNTAIVIALLLSTLLRNAKMVAIMLVALLVMQIGDINAGIRTGVNVFVTYIAMAFVAIESLLLAVGSKILNRKSITDA